ncbi:hypothetical protein MMC22_001787 [Lobaria immixta]|nr:hypothetical protein [Lobaria immixta]
MADKEEQSSVSWVHTGKSGTADEVDLLGHCVRTTALHHRLDDPLAPSQIAGAKRRRRRGLQLESAWKLDDEMLEFPAAHNLIQVVWPRRLEIPGRDVAPEGCEEAPSIQPRFDSSDEGEIGPGCCEEIPSV